MSQSDLLIGEVKMDHRARMRMEVSTDLQKALDSGVGSDVTFIFVEEEGSQNVIGEIKAHKLILSLRSSVFSNKFKNRMEGANDDKLEVSDMTPKAFRILLNFLYSGEVDSEWSSVAEELLYGSFKYDLKSLQVFLIQNVESVLTSKNVMKIRDFATLKELPDVLESTRNFIQENQNIELPQMEEEECDSSIETSGEQKTPVLPAEMVVEIVKNLPFQDQLQCRLLWPDYEAFIRDFLEGRLEPLLLHDWKNKGFFKHLEENPHAPISNELHLESGALQDVEKIREICEIIKAQGRKIKKLKVNLNKNNSFELQKLNKSLDENYVQKYLAANSDLLFSMLEMFGSTLETLELVEFPTGYGSYLMKNQRPLVLPSLKKIILPEFTNDLNKGRVEDFSAWFLRLFKAAPELTGIKERNRDNFIYPLNILNDLEMAGKLQTITSLHLSLLKEEHLDKILKFGDALSLKELIISDFHIMGADAAGKFEKALQILSPKLLKMDVSRGRGNILDIKFPVMQKLTSLGFEFNILLFQNLCWSKDFPKLQYLKIRNEVSTASWRHTFSIVNNPQPCTTVQVMKIKMWGTTKEWKEASSSLSAIFPCIKNLKLVNPNKGFIRFIKGFSTGWQNVTKLELFLQIGGFDHLLFGMTPEWKKALGNISRNEDGWWTSANTPGEPAWTICNLQKLKILKLEFEALGWLYSEDNCGLTEYPFFFGLPRLINLEMLDLILPENCKISEAAFNFLKAERPALVIRRE